LIFRFDTSKLRKSPDNNVTLPIELAQGNQLIHLIMKTIQFILSVLASICAAGMLYGAITTYSPMKTISITIMSIICVGCISLMRMTYKKNKK
jgi:hypothetical protein